MSAVLVDHSSEKFANANGIRICYDTFGHPQAPPMLLVMGLAAQMILWDDDFCRELAATGYYVVRFDNRDIGRTTRMDSARSPGLLDMVAGRISPRLLRPVYTLLDMAKDTVGLMDALGFAAAHVVGVSMGGAIGQELAIHYPQRLLSLTLIMSSTGNPHLPKPEPQALAVIMKPTPTDKASYLERYVWTWRTLAGSHFPFNEERTRQQGEVAYARGINPPGARRQLLAIVASGDRRAQLRTARVPTLVIHGAADPLVPAAAAYDAAQAIHASELEVIEGMGHTMPREVWPQIVGGITRHAAAHPQPGT